MHFLIDSIIGSVLSQPHSVIFAHHRLVLIYFLTDSVFNYHDAFLTAHMHQFALLGFIGKHSLEIHDSIAIDVNQSSINQWTLQLAHLQIVLHQIFIDVNDDGVLMIMDDLCLLFFIELGAETLSDSRIVQ